MNNQTPSAAATPSYIITVSFTGFSNLPTTYKYKYTSSNINAIKASATKQAKRVAKEYLLTGAVVSFSLAHTPVTSLADSLAAPRYTKEVRLSKATKWLTVQPPVVVVADDADTDGKHTPTAVLLAARQVVRDTAIDAHNKQYKHNQKIASIAQVADTLAVLLPLALMIASIASLVTASWLPLAVVAALGAVGIVGYKLARLASWLHVNSRIAKQAIALDYQLANANQ